MSVNEDIYKLLRKFWTIEEPPSTKSSCLFLEEQKCENLFKSTHSRDHTGRYIVRLPFKQSVELLGESYQKTLRIVKSMFYRFKSNPDYVRCYSDFLKEYESLQHNASGF